MTPKDLRIGNLVKVGQAMVTVESVCDDCINFDRNTYRCYNADQISGIPLSEEWLIRLGFNRQTSEHYYIFHKDKVLFSIYNSTLVIEGGHMPVQLKYVHQLQNLYFALTGSELTINNS